MGPALLLLLLLSLRPSLLDASSENCRPEVNSFWLVNQPERLEAPKGGSVCINCSFYHGWELAENPAVNIAWRWKGFHGDYIYNQTLNYTHKKFKDRLFLVWTQGQTQGALLIRNLRREDSTTYFCRVRLTTKSFGIKVFQSIPGTKLTVTPATTTTQGPTSTTSTTRVSTSVKDNMRSEPRPLNLETVAAVAVASAVLITAILGLIFYLRWKRGRGLKAEDTTQARKSLQNTKNKYDTGENKGHHTDAKMDHMDDGITYASLSLSQLTSPANPSGHHPHKGPQEETLYSTLKT